MREVPKFTRLLVIVSLAVLVFALGFAAKHGQFASPGHDSRFLAKAVKMESGNASAQVDLAFEPELLQNSRLLPLLSREPLSLPHTITSPLTQLTSLPLRV